MDQLAQIIFATACLMASFKGIIWAFRCPKDSPNYKLPNLHMGIWREKNKD